MLFSGQQFIVFDQKLKQIDDIQRYDKTSNYLRWVNDGIFFIQSVDETKWDSFTPLFYHATILYGLTLPPKKFHQLAKLTAKTPYKKIQNNRVNLRCLIKGKLVRKFTKLHAGVVHGTFEVKQLDSFNQITFKSPNLAIFEGIDKDETLLIEVDFNRNLHNIFYNCSSSSVINRPSWMPRD